MEVVSGVGKVEDDTVLVSLWALGDRLLVKVWQAKVSSNDKGEWKRPIGY